MKKECIYIGKSQNYFSRHYNHIDNDKYMEEVSKIGLMQMPTLSTMDLLEIYYIGLAMPRYNKSTCHKNEKGIAFQDIKIQVPNFITKTYCETNTCQIEKWWN